MKEESVVVTGPGVVSPLGQDVPSFWTRLLAGEVGTRKITRFATQAYRTDRGGEIPDFRLADHCHWSGEDLPRAAELFLAACSQAIRDSVLAGNRRVTSVDPSRIGIAVETVFATRPSPSPSRQAGREGEFPEPQLLARAPARHFGFAGPNSVLSTGCAAGNDALGRAYELIRSGRADSVIAGGADELSEVVFAIFTSLRALAPDYLRPFDAERKGLMLAEGAAAIVLESVGSARSRGGPIYAELTGHASAADAHHITAPHPHGDGIVAATRIALRRAGLKAEEVDYVSAHGTGTPANDPVEAGALRVIFDGRGEGPAVSGHWPRLGRRRLGARSSTGWARLSASTSSWPPILAGLTQGRAAVPSPAARSGWSMRRTNLSLGESPANCSCVHPPTPLAIGPTRRPRRELMQGG